MTDTLRPNIVLTNVYTAREYLAAINPAMLAKLDERDPNGSEPLVSETDHAAVVADRFGLKAGAPGRFPVAVWLAVFG